MARVRDVVCGMMIDPGTAAAKANHNSRDFDFCSKECGRHSRTIPRSTRAKSRRNPTPRRASPRRNSDRPTAKDWSTSPRRTGAQAGGRADRRSLIECRNTGRTGASQPHRSLEASALAGQGFHPPRLPDLDRNSFELVRDRPLQRRGQPLNQHQDARLAGAVAPGRAHHAGHRHQPSAVTLEHLGDRRLGQATILSMSVRSAASSLPREGNSGFVIPRRVVLQRGMRHVADRERRTPIRDVNPGNSAGACGPRGAGRRP